MRRVSFAAGTSRVEEVPPPEPGEGEVRIRVACAGVSAPVVRGLASAEGAVAPGGDVAGTVTAVGSGVSGFAAGDRVAGIAFEGAYADYAIAAEAFCTRLPDEVDFDSAVGLVRNGQVALGALRAARVEQGETVAVTGAAGGVGHVAVQLARLLGAGTVLAVAGAGKATFLRALGADEALDYERFGEAQRAHRVADGVGGAVLAKSVSALYPFGTVVSYSAADGTVDANALRTGMRTVTGFGMAPFARYRPQRYREQHRQLWRWVREGALVVRTMPFELTDAGAAHQVLGDRAALGKVVLRTS